MPTTTLLALLILTVPPPLPIEENGIGEVVFRCDFEKQIDRNLDRWPDGWQRRKGPGFPSYVKVAIDEPDSSSPSGGSCLKIQLDGGAAVVMSPRIPINPRYGYELSGYLRTDGLITREALLFVSFYDKQDQLVLRCMADSVARHEEWHRLMIAKSLADYATADYAVVSLHVQRRADIQADLWAPQSLNELRGSACFDGIRLAKKPCLAIATGSPAWIIEKQEPISLSVRFALLDSNYQDLHLVVRDAEGQTVERFSLPLRSSDAPQDSTRPSTLEVTSGSDGSCFGHATLKTCFSSNGFYRIKASLQGQGKELAATRNVAVASKQCPELTGNFGWSIRPTSTSRLTAKSFLQLLPHVGIHWVRLPLPVEMSQHEEHRAFVRELASSNIETVGVLQNPVIDTPGGLQQITEEYRTTLSQYAPSIRWWQLGDDNDEIAWAAGTSLRKLSRAWEKFRGAPLYLGFRAQADQHFAEDFLPARSFVVVRLDELAAHRRLPKAPGRHSPQPWTTIRLLDEEQHSINSRAQDLVRQMVLARRKGAAVVLLEDPLEASQDVLREHGAPGAMLLPWRTTATLLTGKQYAGSRPLSRHSHNYAFSGPESTVTVIWNEQYVTEVVELDPHDQVLDQVLDVWGRDVWGRDVRPLRVIDGAENQLQLAVSPEPLFLVQKLKPRSVDPAPAETPKPSDL